MTHPLADARLQAGLSQDALAKSAGCDRVSIARIESRKQRPSLALVGRIIKALKARNVELSADAFLSVAKSDHEETAA